MLSMKESQRLTAEDAAMQKQKLETMRSTLEMGKQLIDTVQTGANVPLEMKQQQWKQMVANYGAAGLPNANMLPQDYPGDQMVEAMKMNNMAHKDQLEFQWKQKGFDQKERELGLRHQEVAIKREQASGEKTDKMAQALDKHLSQGWSGRSGQAGQVQGKINAAEYAEGLVEQGKHQPGGLDSRQIEELAQSTARLLGGTAAASARVEALVPHTLWGQTQSLKEWLTNNPTGQDMQKFVDRMTETISREKAIAQTQQRQFQVEGLPAHAALKKRDPELYDAILKSKGIDSSMIDKNGRYVPAPETKEWNGVTYKKINDQWVPQ